MAARVLVVDDDPVIVRLLEVNLRLEGYEVETASRGEEALERAAATSPDLVILDVMMPGLDGWETCRRLREQPAFAANGDVLVAAGDMMGGTGIRRIAISEGSGSGQAS